MKLVKPSFEIITPINGEEILKQIELAARTCYKSEGKIEYDDFPVIDDAFTGGDYVTIKHGYAKSARVLIPKLIASSHEAMLEFGGNITVKFICDRGVSHELVRHRIASFAQESTRYCNYGNDEHIQFVIPCWLQLNESTTKMVTEEENISEDNFDEVDWANDMLRAEKSYNDKINQLNPKTGKVDMRRRKWAPPRSTICPTQFSKDRNKCFRKHKRVEAYF